jgi:hypothetical protein
MIVYKLATIPLTGNHPISGPPTTEENEVLVETRLTYINFPFETVKENEYFENSYDLLTGGWPFQGI